MIVLECVRTYNFFTCFFFMGIQGYPTGLWYALECLTEVINVCQTTGQLTLRNTSFIRVEMARLKIVKLILIAFP